ncbi:MAG: hypothetical protein UY76_C0034G0011 [Candidatus Uhrbacteria bacterium GW2011_GWA2_52_8d]|uniref:Uncharacterized protein n=1 Tax=Candidatus Uhrbacteria bacterium GW2011_GWA2_52_8d TaxID=1618979 RepID=A0A0G2AI81_9BACT|nr:MAG: hypothetical protein UY76_C0034G0011 [Candidatus Uhrbacteria bacterium GW2011_GWA2_52_8d]
MIANTLSMLKELEERFLHESRPGVRLQILLDSLEEPEEQKEQEQS